MKPRAVTARRSELECFVLGVAWQIGPCSPYELRVHLSRSPSSQWSASAGAIYPLVRRLEKEGLLASRAMRTGKRASRQYRVTAAGLRVLRRWIGPPLAEEAVTVSYDPLRSRARFLGLLSHSERALWIAGARQVLDEIASRVDAWHQAFVHEADGFARLLTRSGEIDIEGRRRWLELLREETLIAGRKAVGRGV